MAPKSEIMPTSRDLRFDSLRGLMLILMTVNHLPTEFRSFTDGWLGVFSSAEGFVFLSGILAGYVYIRKYWRGGQEGLRAAALGRAKSIYGWHVASFIGCLIIVLATEHVLGFCAQSSPQLFYSDPWLALGLGLALLHQPGLLDLLPMYCVFVMLLPMVLPALEAGHRKWVILSSVSLWLAAQWCPPIDGAPIYPVHLGTFNLFAWQLLFVIGMVIGHARATSSRSLVPVNWGIIGGALAIVTLGFGLRHFQWPVPWNDRTFGMSLNKPDLGFLRVANFAAVAYLVAVVGGRFPALLTWRPIAFLGQASIAVVAAQSIAVMFLLQFTGLFATALGRTLVALGTIGFLFISAGLYHRYRRLAKAPRLEPIDPRQAAAAPLDRAA